MFGQNSKKSMEELKYQFNFMVSDIVVGLLIVNEDKQLVDKGDFVVGISICFNSIRKI